MVKSRYGYRTPIPSITTKKAQTKALSFVDGVDTFKDNDDVKPTELVAAIDARFVKIGRYRTRQGLDRYSVPIGEAVNVQQTSTTGAGTYAITDQNVVAQKLTAASAGRVTRIDVNIKTGTSPSGTVLVELYDDDSGVPGTFLGRGSIRSSSITSTAAYCATYVVQAPSCTSSQVLWVIIKGQAGASGYSVTTTTNATTALTSNNDGGTWSAASFAVNVKLYTSTDGGVKGLYRAYRPNGTKETVFWHGTTAYKVNDGTGATTSIQTGLSSSATNYRAQMVQDKLYYVNGAAMYEYDFTTATQVTACPYTPSLLIEHKGLLFMNDATDPSKMGYTNFGLYTTFTSTDFIYVPAPKSADGITAFAKLNGVLYPFTRRNKFQLYGSDNATFVLDEATSQRGTFSQESVVFDANYIFHADDDGIWQFNGTSERNLAEPFLSDYLAIQDKSSIQLELYRNRLYCFYKPAGASDNTECFVMNLQLNKYEALDLNTIVGRTFSRYAQDDIFIQASNRVGALYYGEDDANDNHNLGDQLQYELKTAYDDFDASGQYKRVPKWRPTFAQALGAWSIQAGYAADLATDATYTDVPLAGNGARYDTGLEYDTGEVYSSGSQTIEPTNLVVEGRFKRLQRRYRHVAAREPVEFDTEILQIEAQRLQ